PADGRPVPIVWGLSGRDLRLPENREGYLEAIGRRRPANTEVWELNAPARIGGLPPIGEGLVFRARVAGVGAPLPLVQVLESPIDPVRSASRTVRAMMIRTLAGAGMVCSEAVAMGPIRSIFDDDRACLHERDRTPRPGLVAMDLTAELLNNGSVARWIDLPGGGRVAYFEKDDGRAVAALWRPFGLAATRVSFPALPTTTRVMDCLGMPAAMTTDGDRQVLEIDEIVRYLIVPADQRETLRQALDNLSVGMHPPWSPDEPPASGPSPRLGLNDREHLRAVSREAPRRGLDPQAVHAPPTREAPRLVLTGPARHTAAPSPGRPPMPGQSTAGNALVPTTCKSSPPQPS
ncbi:MAG TPA: hypothetical protein VLM89_08135, partial [Phycisphaerae bacterium]|nr:hypothetical protein [Phycisphaerae bacterium]